MSVEGSKELLYKLASLEESIANDIVLKAVKRADLMVQEQARLLCPFETRNLRRSILTKETLKNSKVIGSVYTNLDYAQYVEFGTGPKGNNNHEGISPNITPRYSLTGWMIPVGHISQSDAEKYHFIPVEKNGVIIGWYTMGQAAKPFLYPALKNNEDIIRNSISKYIQKSLREICKKWLILKILSMKKFLKSMI